MIVDNILTEEDIQKLFSLNVSLPWSMGWKDCDGTYIDCCPNQLSLVKLKNKKELIGKNELSTPLEPFFDTYRKNDITILEKQLAHSLIEPICVTGVFSLSIVKKTPIIDQNKQITGLAFFADIRPIHHIKALFSDGTVPLDKIQIKKQFSGLTERLSEVLFFYIRGWEIKEIASRLNLAVETTREYLDSIKIRLRCCSRRELVEWSHASGFYFFVPTRLIDCLSVTNLLENK